MQTNVVVCLPVLPLLGASTAAVTVSENEKVNHTWYNVDAQMMH